MCSVMIFMEMLSQLQDDITLTENNEDVFSNGTTGAAILLKAS